MTKACLSALRRTLLALLPRERWRDTLFVFPQLLHLLLELLLTLYTLGLKKHRERERDWKVKRTCPWISLHICPTCSPILCYPSNFVACHHLPWDHALDMLQSCTLPCTAMSVVIPTARERKGLPSEMFFCISRCSWKWPPACLLCLERMLDYPQVSSHAFPLLVCLCHPHFFFLEEQYLSLLPWMTFSVLCLHEFRLSCFTSH